MQVHASRAHGQSPPLFPLIDLVDGFILAAVPIATHRFTEDTVLKGICKIVVINIFLLTSLSRRGIQNIFSPVTWLTHVALLNFGVSIYSFYTYRTLVIAIPLWFTFQHFGYSQASIVLLKENRGGLPKKVSNLFDKFQNFRVGYMGAKV